MVSHEMYIAEQTMHPRVEEHLHQAMERNQLRRLRQAKPGLLYRLGRRLIRWGEQLEQYGRSRQPLTLEGPTSGIL